MANVCDCVTRHASLQTDMFAFLVFETRKYTYQVFIGVWTPTNQPRFWSQWPVLDILETHLPWRQRVIQLATVQGHEEEALALRGETMKVTWSCVRCQDVRKFKSKV